MPYTLRSGVGQIKDNYETFDVNSNKETGIIRLTLKRVKKLNTMNLQ